MSNDIVAVRPLLPSLVASLSAAYDVHSIDHPTDIAALTAAAAAARVLVTSATRGTSSALIEALPRLELIAVSGVGVDTIGVAQAQARGIKICNTPDVLNDDVADFAVGLIYAVSRRIAANDSFVRKGLWQAGQWPALTSRVTGKKIGILGLGRIGSAIGRRLEPVAGVLMYHNRHPVPDAPYLYMPTPLALAAQVDILVLSTSGGPDSRHLIDAAVLDALGPSGILINIARGSVIDEAALVEALLQGRLGGAGLDVFEDEPRVPPALLQMDNVVLQPHQASATQETRTAMAVLVLENVHAHFSGRPLITPIG